jgi:hypothetical protein
MSNEAFKGGYKDAKNDIQYKASWVGPEIHVMATSPHDDAISFGRFDFDPETGQHEIVPGSLDIHEDHEGKDVGRGMRRAAQLKADARK